MASAWIRRRPTRDGQPRYRVEYRLGGRESRIRYGGSFVTMREATIGKRYLIGELPARRVPDLDVLREPPTLPTLTQLTDARRVSMPPTTRARSTARACA